MEHILDVTGLNKSYPDFSLQDISFALPDGCITGFIGKNGAGKTTTLKSILGLVPKMSGTIKWFGMDLSSNEKEIKERIGIVLDDGGFYDELTLSEMKSIIASAYKSWSNDDYNMYLARFSLNPKQKISTLSKGMRMKYALQYQRRELNVTTISEKRLSNRKEICAAHGCSLYPISNIFAMAYA